MGLLTEPEILAGALQARVGQRAVALPILSIADNEEWQVLLGQRLASDVAPLSYDTLANLAQSTGATFDTVLDLVVAYDRSNVLGGAKGLRREALNVQVWDIFKRCLEASYPFAHDLRTVALVVMDLITRAQVITALSETTPPTPTDSTPGPMSSPMRSDIGTPSQGASAAN